MQISSATSAVVGSIYSIGDIEGFHGPIFYYGSFCMLTTYQWILLEQKLYNSCHLLTFLVQPKSFLRLEINLVNIINNFKNRDNNHQIKPLHSITFYIFDDFLMARLFSSWEAEYVSNNYCSPIYTNYILRFRKFPNSNSTIINSK